MFCDTRSSSGLSFNDFIAVESLPVPLALCTQLSRVIQQIDWYKRTSLGNTSLGTWIVNKPWNDKLWLVACEQALVH